MEIKKYQDKMKGLFQKYKYAILIVALGLILMLLPGSKEKQDTPSQKVQVTKSQTVQQQLEEILSCLQGAGRVKVMLTVEEGEKTLYETDSDISESESSTSTETRVITVTDSDRNETGLIRQINPPRYLGAIILCQGGDDPALRLAISNAVSKITGLGMDKIAVLKMK